jgi:ABC-2 type transport system permease protein
MSVVDATPRPALEPSALLGRLAWRLFRNGLGITLRQSTVRIVMISALSSVIWLFVFFVGLEGFAFLQTQWPLSGDMLGSLFDMMFFALGILLTFSTGIMLYTSLFTGAEPAFLLAAPLRDDRIFAYKYFSSLSFSSWGFVLLGSPILLAYGLVLKQPQAASHGASWWFFALLPAYFFGFLLIPGALGGMLCLLIVLAFPRRRKQLVYFSAVLLIATALVLLVSLSPYVHHAPWNPDLLQRLIGQVAFTHHPLMPSHWMGRGLRSAARGEVFNSLFALALLWSNGFILFVAAAGLARLLYRRAYNLLATGSELRRRDRLGWIDQTLSFALRFLHPQTRLLIVKDFRLFRRDPAQWLQVFILCGLMALYFSNVRRFFIGDIGWEFQNQISLLNIFATSLLMCTYTGRFVYPMLSLEGKRFWILGLLPLPRQRLVWSKFVFSTVGTLIVAESLVTLSDVMLGLPGLALGIHMLTIAAAGLGLSGLSVGLGALEPNFRETDPSRIAVGFGGTINLGLGLLYVLLILGLMAAPWHLQAKFTDGLIAIPSQAATAMIGGCLLAGLVVAAAATIIPMRLAIRALNKMEF